jgi:hypothetical protein
MTTSYAERIMADPSKNCLKIKLPSKVLEHLIDAKDLRAGHPVGPKLLAKLLEDVCQASRCTVSVKRGKGCDAVATIKFPDANIMCIFGVSRDVSEAELVIMLEPSPQWFWEGRKTPSEAPEIGIVRDKISAALAKELGASTLEWVSRSEFEQS